MASAGLRIADGFELPLDAITETFAFLARRGSGKTYSASVLVEEVVKAGHPAVIIDPLGVWWGLRSSASGKRAGLPVVIFGGDHADLPLDQTQGRVVAEAIVEGRFPAIIDLSLLSKSAARRFTTDFLEALYQRNRQPLMVVVDEADLFAPQRTMPDTARVLGAMEDLVRRGRARGLGVALITQRPAVLNKDVLSQVSVLVTLRMSGTHDVAAIDDWVRLHADEDEARELKRSLPSLPIGTAWIWSPGWLGILQKVRIRRRETFDSSSTPKVGETRIVPTRLADIDLAGLGQKLAVARAEAELNDPAALRRMLASAERRIGELAGKQQAATPAERIVEVPVEVRVEVPVLTDTDRALLDKLAAQLGHAGNTLTSVQEQLDQMTSRITAATTTAPAPRPPMPAGSRGRGRLAEHARQVQEAKADLAAAQAAAPAATTDDPDEVKLRAGANRIVETIARHYPQWLTKSQIGVLTSFKVTGGTFNTYWGAIRRAGLVEMRNDGKEFRCSEKGLDYAGVDPGSPLTKADVLDLWRGSLRAGARTMLDVIVEAWPNGFTRAELADRVGMAMSGGTFNTYLGTLRRNGLVVEVDGVLRAADIIVERG